LKPVFGQRYRNAGIAQRDALKRHDIGTSGCGCGNGRDQSGRLRNAVFGTRRAGRLPANVIAVTPYTILQRVQPACAVLKDTQLCEIVDDLWRHS
jgi:hypothetical protein